MSPKYTSSAQPTRHPELNPTERKQCAILIIDPDPGIRHSMKQSIQALGFPNIFDASDHAIALQKIEDKKFSHIIFDAKNSVIPARDFLRSALELERHAIFIPTSYDPTVDDVFNLLTLGARGYIVKPFTSDAIDRVLGLATKGEPICEAILNAKDRNEALASLVLNALDKLAAAKRQARRFATAERELPTREIALRRAVELGKTFAKGGAYGLFETLMRLAIERSEEPQKSEDIRPKKRKESKRKEPRRDPAQSDVKSSLVADIAVSS